MSHLKSQPYLPAEGREFVEYMGRVLDGVTELRAEGRIPDDEGVDKLLQLWRTVTKQVKSDTDGLGPDASRPITSTIPMTATEFQQSSDMFGTFYNLLRILEMRGAINLRRSDGVSRVAMAVYEGTLI
ncbi:MAG TPA: hypothetical protein VHB18_15040 [Mycobacteriales bacterium]|jgi:hypothetical protein|nr:hypothetical protein [Mycobacteriales bacterium]